jgi:uncharacterized protein (DUF362 family)
MVHDLNLILCYADQQGKMTNQLQRTCVHLVDGVIGGEGDAPLDPRAHPAGCLVAGTNPVAVDGVAAALMGLDVGKVPLLREGARVAAGWQLPCGVRDFDRVPVRLVTEGEVVECTLEDVGRRQNLDFAPPEGWVGKIERDV